MHLQKNSIKKINSTCGQLLSDNYCLIEACPRAWVSKNSLLRPFPHSLQWNSSTAHFKARVSLRWSFGNTYQEKITA